MLQHAAIRQTLFAAVLATLATRPALAVEPGIDIASPRVAITTVDAGTVAFHPNRIVVEQNDHVRWTWTGGLHNTTSGSACVGNGLWNAPLNGPNTGLTRLFPEPPSTIPFFCMPHCGFMTGQVVVTSEISVLAKESGASVQLDWTGGGGIYRIFRSSNPLFPAATTAVLTAANGTNALTFLDQTGGTPPVGGVNFYLVMNHF